MVRYVTSIFDLRLIMARLLWAAIEWMSPLIKDKACWTEDDDDV